MIVNAEKLFESVIEKQLRMTYYKEIMQAFPVVDVSSDDDFRRAYTYFYRVRRGVAWRDAYFSYMQECKELWPDFETALMRIYELTGNCEPSFTSKLLATVDPDMPIWDSIVFNHLGLSLQGRSKEEKLQDAVRLYDRLCIWYSDFLQTDDAARNIEIFDRVLPSYRWMSRTKKIDFIMWGDRND